MTAKHGCPKQGEGRINPLTYIEQQGLSSRLNSLQITLWCSGTEF